MLDALGKKYHSAEVKRALQLAIVNLPGTV